MEGEKPQEPLTPQEPIKTAPVKEIIKTPNNLVILMVVVILLLLGLVGYLIYLNINLQKQLSVATTVSSPSPSPTPTVKLYSEQIWLTTQQLNDYLSLMGIKNIPDLSLGMPYLAVDWDIAATNLFTKADAGRMVAFGFEKFHEGGSRWGRLNIIYSTYDFSVGSEYSVYATPSDLQKTTSTTQDITTFNNLRAITKYTYIPLLETIEKSVTFPFSSHYVTFVYHIPTPQTEPSETQIQLFINQLKQGDYPEELKEELQIFDQLVSNTTFSLSQ